MNGTEFYRCPGCFVSFCMYWSLLARDEFEDFAVTSESSKEDMICDATFCHKEALMMIVEG